MSGALLLSGATAIVTGASRGIGAAVATALARAGADVGLISRDATALEGLAHRLRAETTTSVGVRAADVTHDRALTQAIDELATELGAPTILVNNAGAIERAAFEDTTPESWQRVLDTNLGSAAVAAQGVLPYLRSQSGGSIVNITSLSAHFGIRRAASYGAAKSGLVGLTRALALELAPDAIRVNAITPGYIATDFTQPIADDGARSERITQRIPLGRWGRPEDIAGTVAYLSSSLASYVTGQVIVVDGGYSIDG